MHHGGEMAMRTVWISNRIADVGFQMQYIHSRVKVDSNRRKDDYAESLQPALVHL